MISLLFAYRGVYVCVSIVKVSLKEGGIRFVK